MGWSKVLGALGGNRFATGIIIGSYQDRSPVEDGYGFLVTWQVNCFHFVLYMIVSLFWYGMYLLPINYYYFYHCCTGLTQTWRAGDGSHMFAFYFGIIADVTPVALAAYGFRYC